MAKIKMIAIGSDHAGFALKEKLKKYLIGQSVKIKDMGTYSEDSCDYPLFAAAVARAVSKGNYKRGLLICKSGIGNSIAANKFPGVRAALCYNKKAAQLSREHNDSNILVLGSGFVSTKTAKETLKVWLNADFQGGRHKRRLGLIRKIEKELIGKK